MTAPHGGHEPESALAHAERVVRELTEEFLHVAELALHLPERPDSRWHRAGISGRGERVFNVVSGLVLALLAVGWTYSIAIARSEGGDAGPTTAAGILASALTDPDAPTAAFLTDAALAALSPERGASGKLRAQLRVGDAPVDVEGVPAGTEVALTKPGGDSSVVAPGTAAPGVWQLALRAGEAVRPVADFDVINMLPFSAKRGGRIGSYVIGSWPYERGRAPKPGYAPPRGFIEVTPDNQGTPLSDHFRLQDFLTHDQQDVWPKYLVVETKLVDKLELVLSDLERRGVRVGGVHVMSGFRTPQYNVGGGDPSGRAALSRHMYGDASDIYIDADGNGTMDDLNHDGRVNIRDAEVIQAAVDRVEREHPALVGGCGTYAGNAAHGPFTHIDTRGYRARWVGTGDS